MHSDEVMRWVAAYEQGWRDQDETAVQRLFTEDAHYRQSPYEPAKVGHQALTEFWLADGDESFTARVWPVAVQDRNAVVRVDVVYQEPHQEYRDVWLLRFASDGRVEDFEEWAYWPDRSYTAD